MNAYHIGIPKEDLISFNQDPHLLNAIRDGCKIEARKNVIKAPPLCQILPSLYDLPS